VKFGVHLPQWGPAADRKGVIAVAKAAEETGLDSVWVADHIVFPISTRSRYPYRDAGVPFTAGDGFLEALTTLAVIAGATTRLRLGTSVLVLPMREPLLAAKTIATLDVLSEGRTTLALGAGWWREEFDALAVPFARRGRRFDEQLRLLRRAWTDGVVSSDAGSYRFSEVACLPRPVQPGGPPVLIGGMGPAAWLRTVRYGDGWHAVGGSPGQLAEARRAITELAHEHGRDPASIRLSISTGFGRSIDQATERMAALAAAGFQDIVLNLPRPDATAADVCSAIETFAGKVRPAVDPPTEEESS
jgi:probable F420-dependent oxidoreductase